MRKLFARSPLPAAVLLTLIPSARAAGVAESIAPVLSYTGEAASMLDGGKRSGNAYAGQLKFGADIDLERAFGWHGATLKAYGVNRHGTDLTHSSLGNSTSVQETYGGQGTRLANLTIEQRLFDERLVLEGGRGNAGDLFLGQPQCEYFQGNAVCGNPTYVFRTSHFTWWPVSSWMLNATAHLTPHIYVQVGGFQVDPSQAEDNEHGLRWNTHGATGWVVPYAIGWQGQDQPGRKALYEVGGWQDNSPYSEPLHDRNGVPALLSGQDYATAHGRSGAFARAEQQLTGDDDAHGLNVFAAVFKGTSGQLIEDWYAQLGLVQKGTFAGRPEDSFGIVVSRQQYSDIALENQRLARAQAGGSGTPQSSQTIVELSYGIQLAPKLRLTPNLHYLVHPDQFNEPARPHDLDNALVAGLRVDWNM